MFGHPSGVFDNSAKEYQHIQVTPLAAAMGAEISGVHLSDVSEAAFEEIRDALYRHKMVYFRDQEISHGDHESFSAMFGPFADDAYTEGVEGHRPVQPVLKKADTKVAIIFGSNWHLDSPFLPEPPSFSFLRGVDIPPYGGDTMWTNTVLAHNTLSKTMQEMLSNLNVHMSIQRLLVDMYKATLDGSPEDKFTSNISIENASDPALAQQKVTGAVHPMVRTHPITGEKALCCDKTYTTGIDGMTDEEAWPIINFVVDHIIQAAFTCRLRWEPNTFAMWDNRLCLHQAFNDHDGFRREMFRTTVAREH